MRYGVIQKRVPFSEQALRELEPVLFRFALRATRDADLSRDLTQEALLAALTQEATFAGRSSLRTWVVGILSHKVINHFRRRADAAVRETTRIYCRRRRTRISSGWWRRGRS